MILRYEDHPAGLLRNRSYARHDLVETAFARSSFDCYSQFSGILAAHLQTIIEVHDDRAAETEIPLLLSSLEEKIAFMRNDRGCEGPGNCVPLTHITQ